MQELQFHVRGYKVKHFTLVRSDLCCQRQFCSSKWKEIGVSWTDHQCCWVILRELLSFSKTRCPVLSLQLSPSSASSAQLCSGAGRDCPFFTWQGDRGFGQKCCLVDELQKPTWTLLSFSVIPAPNFPSFYSRSFFSVRWVIPAMMRLLYFFLSL